MSSDLELDQEDFHARVDADPFFDEIKVLLQRKGVTESDIAGALSVLNDESGKIGCCVIVLMPSLQPDGIGLPTPVYQQRIAIQVIEQPLFNLGDTGSGVSAERAAERIRQLGHHFATGRDGSSAYYVFDGMEPAPVAEGQVSYAVYFRRKAGDDTLARVPPVTLAAAAASPSGFDITLTCSDGAASIYYSTDGSYPSEAYTVPFNVAAGTTIRATARRTGYQESNPRELTV